MMRNLTLMATGSATFKNMSKVRIPVIGIQMEMEYETAWTDIRWFILISV